jgi:hypothetical protein
MSEVHSIEGGKKVKGQEDGGEDSKDLHHLVGPLIVEGNVEFEEVLEVGGDFVELEVELIDIFS